MKFKYKIIIILILFLYSTVNVCIAQNKQKDIQQTTVAVKNDSPSIIKQKEDLELRLQIVDLNKQIADLSKSVGDTKQAFYDSRLNLWNYILAGFGLLIIFLGSFGYSSISGKIISIRTDIDKTISRNENEIKENKSDLIQRIGEIKTDIHHFKIEEREKFEKFEREANQKIENGLDLSLQRAIEKIMKESFNDQLGELSDNVADLTNKYEILSAKQEKPYNEPAKVEDNLFAAEGEKDSISKTKQNAFDGAN